MSVAALLLAVRDTLRSGFPFEPHECDANIDGRPQFWRGDRFVAVWCNAWDPGNNNPTLHFGIHENYEFTCTITYAVGDVPDDEQAGKSWLDAQLGMEATARCIMAVICRNRYNIKCRANDYILNRPSSCGATTGTPIDICTIQPDDRGLFLTPPRWLGTDPSPRPVGAEWFTAEPSFDPDETDESAEGQRGLILEVRFGNVQRMQDMAIMA